MKKISKSLCITLAMTSLVFAAIPVTYVKAASTPVFDVGACGPTPIYYWSMESYIASDMDYYLYNALENLYIWAYDTEDGQMDKAIPVLATNWTLHDRDIEDSAKGFTARNGYDYMDLTLREGVTFHDGSDWNATVCKWNIDRLMYLLGNFNNCLGYPVNGYVDATRPQYWLETDIWAPYATDSWNVSELTAGAYGEFGITPDTLYNGTEDSRFPRYKNVTVIDSQQSGGTVRVYFNDWGGGPNSLAGFEFISQASYKAYFDRPILGYGSHTESEYPGDYIGTGPYIFEDHSLDDDYGTMVRNPNWWNSSAERARGWHRVPRVGVRVFTHDTAGYAARTTAMGSGAIDYATERGWEPLGTASLIAGGVNYVDMGVEPYGENIVFNCIDETYLAYWAETHLNVSELDLPGALGNDTAYPPETVATYIETGGVNRAMRKAISYAYDYDNYIASGREDRVVRSGGLLGIGNEFYNGSIGLAYENLTIARRTLCNDTYWGPICDSLGVNESSSTAEWEQLVTDSTPVFEFVFSYDYAHIPSFNALQTSCQRIGVNVIPNLVASLYYYVTLNLLPIFEQGGFSISPFQSRINNLGYTQAYMQSSGVIQRAPLNDPSHDPISDYPNVNMTAPYDYLLEPRSTYPDAAASNMGFNYNETCDNYIMEMFFSNSTRRQTLYNELADWAQNFQYPVLYLSNEKTGYAIGDEWETQWHSVFFSFSFTHVKYTGESEPEIIPGYGVGILLPVALLSLAGIAFTIIRRRKITFN